jgi:hypothetical protein
MLTQYQVYKEKKNDDGLVYLYLLKHKDKKDTYCTLKIDDDFVILLNKSFVKSEKDISDEDWENISEEKQKVENYIFFNMDIEQFIELENNFYQPNSDLENKTILLDF